MKKYLSDFAAITIILFIVGAFFFPFFFPEAKLLVTPDFGRSDSWHFSLPTKYLLWKGLQHNSLPLWSPLLGAGFPVFSEGQVGALYPLNLFLFKFFDFAAAYNLALAATVGILSVGTYLFLRVITKNRLGSLLGATAIVLSGIVIPQLPHITLLQGVSLMPWILLATHLLIAHPSFYRIAGLAILLALQVFTGFPQATFITILFGFAYLLWNTRPWKKHVRLLVYFIAALVLGIALGAVQIAPSMEFLSQISKAGGFSAQDASYYSFPWGHLTTLVDPFRLGNPQKGTYPPFAAFDGSIFWENTVFIGLVPLIFALIGLICHIGHIRQKRGFSFFLVSGLMSLLLMTGKYSPFYLVFSFWPMTLFRVPSRFIWIFVMSLLVLAAYGVREVQLRIRSRWMKPVISVILFLLVLVNTIHLWITWNNYHLLQPATLWLTKPTVTDALNSKERTLSIATENIHNSFFIPEGWKNPEPYYSLRSALAPDSNVFWNVSGANVYAGRSLRRKNLIDGLVLAETRIEKNIATISAFGEKLLSLQSTATLVSALPLTVTTFEKVKTISDQYIPLYIYTNRTVAPRVYLADTVTTASTLTEAVNAIRRDDFIIGRSALSSRQISSTNKQSGDAHIIDETDTRIKVEVKRNSSDALLVLTDTYYPGWKATVNGKQAEIFPVNIFQRGLIVPAGNSQVVLNYEPESIIAGAVVSILALSLILILMGYPLGVALFRTARAAPARARGSFRSRARALTHKG